MGKWVQNRDANWKIPYTGGWCLKYVREAFGIGPKYPTATSAWQNAQGKHYDLPPTGITVPVYFALGSEPAGHIAIRLDDMKVASSTQSGTHPQGFIHPSIQNMIDMYAKYNKGCTYLGWSEELHGTTIVSYVPEITTQNIVTTEDIPFKTIETPDNTIAVGQTHVANEGTIGVRTIVTTVTYSDGKEVSRAVTSDSITTGVIDKNILVGTKEPDLVPEPIKPPVIDNSFIIKAIRFIIKLIKLIIGAK
jgi:hypothetical protein